MLLAASDPVTFAFANRSSVTIVVVWSCENDLATDEASEKASPSDPTSVLTCVAPRAIMFAYLLALLIESPKPMTAPVT